MIAIIAIAAVFVVAGFFGWLVRRLIRSLRSSLLRGVLSTGAGLLAFVVAGLVMVITGLFVPAADDSMFGHRTAIRAEFCRKPFHLERADIWLERSRCTLTVPTLTVWAATP